MNHNQSETGGFPSMLELNINGRIIITVNVDLEDSLLNGKLSTVKHSKG